MYVQYICSIYVFAALFLFFPAKRFILVPQPRPTLLRASSLLPVKASSSPLLTQGLNLCPTQHLSTQHPLLSALHLQPPLPTPILSHLENLLPQRITATRQPYPTRQTVPPGPAQRPHKRLAWVGMKPTIHRRPIVHQRRLKDVQMLKSSASPIQVVEAVKDNFPEKGRERNRTPLTGAETGTDTTGTGARSKTTTAIVIGTDASTETTTTTVRTGIVWTLTTALTKTGRLSAAGNSIVAGNLSAAGRGPFTTRGSAIATGAPTITTTTITNDTETTGTASGGVTATPTVTNLTVAQGGSRTVETLGQWRTRATAGRGIITLQKRRPLHSLRCQKHPPSPRVHLCRHLSPHLDPFQTERIKITRGLLFLWAKTGMTAQKPDTLKNTKRARKRRSPRIKTDTVRAGEWRHRCFNHHDFSTDSDNVRFVRFEFLICVFSRLFFPIEAPTWIQTEPPKQKRKRRKRRGSAAQAQVGATRPEAARKGRAASDDTTTPRTLKTTMPVLRKNAGAQTTPTATAKTSSHPGTPHPRQTVQLTATWTDTQV